MSWRQILLSYWEEGFHPPEEEGIPQPLGIFSPPMDIYERSDCIVVELELPGVEPEAIRVDVARRSLVIQGQKLDAGEAPKRYLCAERAFGAFRRTLVLPEGTAGGRATAEFAEGILRLRIPKMPAAQRVAVEEG